MIFWTAAFTGLNLSTKGAFVPAKITVVITETGKETFLYSVHGAIVGEMTKNEMEAAKLLVHGINGKTVDFTPTQEG